MYYVNQTERVAIFTLYLAVESKMLKKTETLKLCGYVIPRPKERKKLPTNCRDIIILHWQKKQTHLIPNLFLNKFSSALTADPHF